MALLPLCHHPHPALRSKANRVRVIDGSIKELASDMIDTMRHHSGVGLAAPQVGVRLRLIVLELPDQPPMAIVNPEMVRRRGEREVEEGCLSYAGYRGKLRRSQTVTIKGLDLEGKELRIKAEGLLAQALEHELDHLNGVLYFDRAGGEKNLYPVEAAPPP